MHKIYYTCLGAVLVFLGVSIIIFVHNITTDNTLKIELVAADLDLGKYSTDCGLIEKTISFKNNSSKSVYVKALKMSCNCASFEYVRGMIKPGENGWIKVKIDSMGKRAKEKIEGVIVFSPYQEQQVSFVVDVEFYDLLSLIPSRLNSVEIDLLKPTIPSIKVQNRTTSEVRVIRAETLNNYILPEDMDIDVPVSPGGEVLLSLTINDKVPLGEFKDEIYLYTDSDKIPKKVITINGYVQKGDFTVSNRYVEFGFISELEGITKRSISISSKEDVEFRIVGYECQDELFILEYPETYDTSHIVEIFPNSKNIKNWKAEGIVLFDIQYKNGIIGKTGIHCTAFYN